MKQWIIILSLLLLVTACENFGFGGQQEQLPQGAFAGGTKGVEVAFAEDQPPSTVLDDDQQTFLITLLVRNEGEFDIPSGGLIASLSGINRQAFGLSTLDKKNEFEITGKTKEETLILPGSEEFIEFDDASYTIDVPADFQTRINADICYVYQTSAIENLCVKKDVLQTDIGDACETNNPNMQAENSGGPIQFTNMRQSAVGRNKIKVSFKVRNQGVGAVYPPGTFTQTCGGMKDSKDKLKVSIFTPQGNLNFDCNQLGGGSSGVVRLVNKEKDVTCTAPTSSLQEQPFQQPIIVQADYMYRELVFTNVLVRDAT